MKTRHSQRFAGTALGLCVLLGSLPETRLRCAADDRPPTPAEISNVVGEYYESSGYAGSQLSLHADKTFTYEEMDDTTMDVKWSGSYQLEHNLLTLHPAAEIGTSVNASTQTNLDGTEEKSEYHWPLGETLYCLSWEKRLYLLTSHDMLSFCNDVNLGREPRRTIRGAYLVRASPPRLFLLPPVRSLPLLPAPWNTFVLSKPIVAKVVAIVPTGRKEKQNGNVPDAEIMALTLNKGACVGLKTGMVLALPTHFEGLKIVVREVQQDQCVAEWVSFGPDREIRIGTRFSTRLNKASVQWYQHWPKTLPKGGG